MAEKVAVVRIAVVPVAVLQADVAAAGNPGSPCRVLSFADVLRRWQDDQTFRSFFIASLAASPYSACRWETPALTERNLHRDFECVLIEDLSLVRHAPLEQQHLLWKKVGRAMQRRLSKDPVWLSTAGDGVAWLHVRLDDRPKYYAFEPYR